MPQLITARVRSPRRDWIGGRLCAMLAAVFACGTALGHRHSSFQSSLGAQGQQRQPWFEEVAEQRGLKFAHQSGEAGEYLLPEIMGGGAALFDMDADGDLDAYLVQSGKLLNPPANQPPNRLYRNRGNGTFDDVTDGSGADTRGYGMGVTAGDYDNDRDVDLYVTNVGANVLLQNDGRGRFKDVTGRAGVGDPAWSTSAAFLDFDGDGDLDLYVANYIVWPPPTLVRCFTLSGARDYCSPKSYNARSSDTLYRNNGNGTFTDISAQAGIRKAFATGLGVVSGDFDGNGSLDVFVANDGMPNQLWLNRGGGRFHDDALARGCAIDQDGRAKAGMGVHAADVDDDGDLDLLVVNLEHESDSFYRNEGKFFVDDTLRVGLRTPSRSFTRFGMGLLDFDNDGRLDLYEANGRISRGHAAGDPYAEPNLLFRGVPGGRFEEVRPRGGTSKLLLATSRAAAFGDVDNDGGTDIVVVNRDAPAYLLRNTVPSRGHWISFRLLDEHGRDALGARLTLSVGHRTITREVQTAYSYLASNDPRVHVGLGSSTRVTDVRVRWPDGKIESFGDVAGDRIVTLRREGGGPAQKTSRGAPVR